MEYKIIGNIVTVRIDRDEDIVSEIGNIIEKENIKLGIVSGIGAAKELTIGYFDTSTKEYHSKEFKGNMEISAVNGNVSTMDGKPYVHLHINFSDETLKSFSGHMNKGIIGATFEGFIQIIDGEVDRKFSDEIGLNLIKFN